MKSDPLRTQLVKLLTGEQAHMSFADMVADFPETYYNEKPPHVSYTPWHLLEHLRIAQKDILDFILVDGYQEKIWPDDYWPQQEEKAGKQQWETTIKQFRADNEALQNILETVTFCSNAPAGPRSTLQGAPAAPQMARIL